MPIQVLQRPDWHGTPITLGELFIVRKGRRTAECRLFTHQFGWELRLCIGRGADIVQSQVCRDQECVLSTDEQWKAARLAKGWH